MQLAHFFRIKFVRSGSSQVHSERKAGLSRLDGMDVPVLHTLCGFSAQAGGIEIADVGIARVEHIEHIDTNFCASDTIVGAQVDERRRIGTDSTVFDERRRAEVAEA